MRMANGDAQAVEALFDGANGEAASSADYLDPGLEDLWLFELEAAETMKGLDEEVAGL